MQVAQCAQASNNHCSGHTTQKIFGQMLGQNSGLNSGLNSDQIQTKFRPNSDHLFFCKNPIKIGFFLFQRENQTNKGADSLTSHNYVTVFCA